MEQVDLLTETTEEIDKESSLILWNDEVNSFEHVIFTLTDVCGMSAAQAEQLAIIAHTKGKVVVKHGAYVDLLPVYEGLSQGGLMVEII